jgi:TetR/AcrR family transcriptional repressor of bet genes
VARPSNTHARRAQIVDALARVMAEHGYDGATIPRIAEAAGLAPGLVHYHFGSKDEILLALVASLWPAVEARFEARAASARSAEERLDAFLDAHLALGPDARPELVRCWVLAGAEALRRPEVATVHRAALDVQRAALLRLVRAALDERGRPTRDAPALTAALQAAILGAYHLATAGGAPRGFAARTVRAMARGLLDAPASPTASGSPAATVSAAAPPRRPARSRRSPPR